MDLNRNNPKSNLINAILIAVIILFAVIIVLMGISMRAMRNDKNKKPEDSSGNDTDNIIVTENITEDSSEIPTAEHIETPSFDNIQQTTEPEIEVLTAIAKEPSFHSYEYTINNVGVMVYESTNFDSKPIDYISDRGTYTIIDEYQNWGKLKSGGWINFDVASESGSITYLGMGEVVTKKDPLNLRTAPDMDAKIITTIPKGESVEIYESEYSDWYYADYNGKFGFINKEYISFDNFHVTLIKDYLGKCVVATKKDPLNVRSDPSTSASVVTTIPKGTTIEVYSTFEDGWYYVTYNGKSGYISSQYISFDDTYVPQPENYVGSGIVATKKDPLNVRSSPSTSASVVTTIPKGTAIDVYTINDSDWYYVIYNGKSGYISSQYISFDTSSSSSSVTSAQNPDNTQYFAYGFVNTKKDPLNVHSAPSQDSSVVTTIPHGTNIDLYKTDECDENWFYVTYNGVSGYVSASYIEPAEQATAYVKTSGSNLYLRDEPSTDGNILDKIPNGTMVVIIEYSSDWCYIEYNGTYGYASTQYLSF